MPVGAFTLVGSTLDATIVDGNFELLKGFLQEQALGTDTQNDTLNKFVIRELTGSKISSATVRAHNVLDYTLAYEQQNKAYNEVTYRNQDVGAAAYISQQRFMMELLGRPGPSFYWDFQEDGIVYGNAPDPNRYAPGYCYSMWQTVPFTSLKVYVPQACVVRMRGLAYYLGNYTSVAEFIRSGGLLATWENAAPPNRTTLGKDIAMRLGLFVDTNPNLYLDEFVNSNPNILAPDTGVQATHCSWQMVEDKTVHSPQWQLETISGEVVLKGGRWYNFSMKYRGAGTVGYRAAGADPFIDNVYEFAGAALPNFNGSNQNVLGTPPFSTMWISSTLSLEFIYGYGSIQSDTSLIGNVPA